MVSLFARFVLTVAVLSILVSCTSADFSQSATLLGDDTTMASDSTLGKRVQLSLLELDFRTVPFQKRLFDENSSRVLAKTPISKYDYQALEAILLDSSSYDQYTAACFHPNFGLIKTSPDTTGSFEIYGCLSCNNARFFLNDEPIDTVVQTIPKFGFSEKARGKIRAILSVYQHDVANAFYPMFDHPYLYLQNQLSQGRDSLEIIQDFDWGDKQFSEPEIQDFGPLYEWRKRPTQFFATENIGQLVYEYNQANDDRFTRYIGDVEIESGRYHICTVFARNQAAMVMHGHSHFFVLDKDQNIHALYYAGAPDILPIAIHENQLVFQTEYGQFKKDAIEIELPYLCLPAPINCIEKGKSD